MAKGKVDGDIDSWEMTAEADLTKYQGNEEDVEWWESLDFGTVTRFVVIWQLMSNHGLIRLKKIHLVLIN